MLFKKGSNELSLGALDAVFSRAVLRTSRSMGSSLGGTGICRGSNEEGGDDDGGGIRGKGTGCEFCEGDCGLGKGVWVSIILPFTVCRLYGTRR